MTRSLGYALALVLALAATGCATIIPYEPRPASVVAPDKQITESLNFGTLPPVKIEITDTYLKVVDSSPNNGETATVLRFSTVGTMTIQQYSVGTAKYLVMVNDTAGARLFVFWTSDLAGAQRFIDAVAALRARAPKS